MDKAERGCDIPEFDLSKSFEGSSSTDLNKGFFLDKSSSVFVPSLDLQAGHQKKHLPCSTIVVEYSEDNVSNMASWIHSPSIFSPSFFLPHSNVLHNETPKLNIIPVGSSKSSTPHEDNVKKPILRGPLEVSCVDNAASPISWEISLIKPGPVSPCCTLESSLLDELTWSPKYLSPPASLVEISSLIMSGTSLLTNVCSEQEMTQNEVVCLKPNEDVLDTPSVACSEDQWQKCTALQLKCAAKNELSLSK